jgi:hypothetical protein
MNDNTPSAEIDTAPLVNWKNAPTVRDLKQDLEDAKPIHDGQVLKIGEWLDNLHVTGKAKVPVVKGNSSIVPKLIRKQAEWRYASLSEPFLSTDDVFNVRPVSWEDRGAAQQNQLLLNHQFNNVIDKTRFIDEYVRAAVDEGTVIVRTGWEFREEEYEEEVPVVEFQVNEELAPLHEQLHQLMQESPSQWATDVPEELKQAHELTMEQGMPIEPVVVGQRWETKTRVVKNAPTLEVCDYRNVVIDPTCMGDIGKASFVIYSFETSLAELKKDGKYKNLDKIQIGSNSALNQPDHASPTAGTGFNFSDEPRKKFVVYEYWGFRDIDGDGKVKPIVAAWVGSTMIRLEANPFPDQELPFVVEQYLPVRRSNYGEPDGALLEDNQRVMGAVTRGMIDLMGKSANGQTGMRKDMLDATNRRKFDKGLDYEFNANVDPRQGVHMHAYPEIPTSAQFMLQLQQMEAESMTGVKAYSQGVSGQSLGDVAAGVRGALDAASKRELGILRRLSNGIVKIGRKFISMNSEFLSEEEVVRVTNEQFVTVRRDDLAGKFDLKLSISTAEEDNNKAEQLAFMLQTVGPNADSELLKMILADITRLRKMPDLAKKIESYQPQPDPLAQKKAELEIALLEAQLQNEQAQAMQRQASAQLDQAKIGTEQAKASHLQSDADLKNLDFVEQESGVKQERAKELHGEQARSQAQLKLLDRQLDAENQDADRKVDLLKEYMRVRARAT